MRLGLSLRHNLGLKLLSIALALLLWSFVRGTKVVEREIDVPIQYVNLADSLMFFEEAPEYMRVLVSGPAQELLLRLRFMRDVAALIDLSEASAPVYRIVPGTAQIATPSNHRISMERILSPTVLNLRLARRAEREVPVRVVLRGAVPEGYVLMDSPSAAPAKVRCSGPAILIDEFQEVSTMPLELRRSRSLFTEEIELFYDRAHLTCVPEKVTVTIPMARLRNLALPATPLTIVPPAAADLVATPDAAQASLTLEGPEGQIEALAPEDVALVLDVSALEPGRYDSLAVVPYLPDWARLVSLKPATVGVTIRAQPANLDDLLPSDSDSPEQESSSLP